MAIQNRFVTSDEKAAKLYRRFQTCNDLDRMRKIDRYITKELRYPSAFSITWIEGKPDITWANPNFKPLSL